VGPLGRRGRGPGPSTCCPRTMWSRRRVWCARERRSPSGCRVFDERGDPLSSERPRALRVTYRDWSHYASGKAEIESHRPCYADDGFFMSCHGTTHMDALGHIWVDDKLWNGYPAKTTAGGLERCSIAPISQRGVFCRAVLFDVAAARGVPYLPRKSEITLRELLSVAGDFGVEVKREMSSSSAPEACRAITRSDRRSSSPTTPSRE